MQFLNQGTVDTETNAVLEIRTAGSTAQFQNGSVFNGAGLLRIPANSSVMLDGTLTVNGTVEFGGNSQMGWPVWTGPGLLRWTGGGMESFTFAPGFHTDLTGTNDKTFSGSCTNLGLVEWQSSGRLLSSGYSGFVNLGQFLVETNCVLDSMGWPSGSFTNSGTLLKPAGSGTAQLQVKATSFLNQGIIDVETNAVLEIVSDFGAARFQNGSVFNGSGLLRVPANSSVLLDGTLTVNGTVEFGGNSQMGWPVWTGPGLLRWTGGGMESFTFASGFHTDLTGTNDKTFSGSCTNLGLVEWQSSGRLLSSSYSGFVNLGQFLVETNCVLDTMGWPSGSFTNSGTLLKPAGSGTAQLQVKATSFLNQGIIDVETNAVLEIVSDFGAARFQNGSVFNGSGLLRVPANSSVLLDGTLTVNGTVEFGGNSQMGWPVWTGPGLLRWTGGGMESFTFAPGFHTDLTGTNDKTFSGSCTNLGLVEWQSSGRLLSSSYSGFVNLGQFVVETNCVLDSTVLYPPAGSFTNFGTVLRPAGSGTARLQANNSTPFVNQGIIDVETNAVLEIVSDFGAARFQNGSVFNGSGLLRIPANSSVLLDGTLTVNGTVEFGGNSQMGWPVWTGPGLLRWTGGGMESFTFASGFHTDLTGTNDKTFSGSCTNLGLVEWQSSGRLLSSSYSGFVNLGQFVVETNCVLDSTVLYPPAGSFTNFGTVLRPAGSGTARLQANNSTPFVNQGIIDVETNAVLEIVSDFGAARFQNGSVFNGSGLLRVPANSSVLLDGTLTVNGTVEFGGNSQMGWPVWTGPGLLRWTGGGMESFTFAPGFHTDLTGTNDKTFSGSCTNLGILCWAGNSSVLSAGCDFREWRPVSHQDERQLGCGDVLHQSTERHAPANRRAIFAGNLEQQWHAQAGEGRAPSHQFCCDRQWQLPDQSERRHARHWIQPDAGPEYRA